MNTFSKAIVEALKEGKIGVIPTDTLYGLVGSALSPEVVERIYLVRKRDLDKPCIVLIARISDIERFGVSVLREQKDFLRKWWPGKVSVILPCKGEAFGYLHRGQCAIAFRCPDNEELCRLLEQTGPLVAPSANTQDTKPATTIEEAKEYLGDRVDFYVDGGTLQGEPSTLVRMENGKVEVLRRGAVEI